MCQYLDAAEDVFSRLPIKSDTRETITVYHQLEQLLKHVSDAELQSIKDENVRKALVAVSNVHNNNAEKKARLSETLPSRLREALATDSVALRKERLRNAAPKTG